MNCLPIQPQLLLPVAQDSGTLRGKRAVAGGRRALLQVMFRDALVAAHRNTSLKPLVKRLGQAGKPHSIMIKTGSRKLVTLVNDLRTTGQKRVPALSAP